MSEERGAPFVLLPSLGIEKELGPLIQIVEDKIKIPVEQRKNIRKIKTFYIRSGAERIFRMAWYNSELMDRLDLLERFTAVDEVVTDFDIRDLSRIRQKSDFVRKKITEARNFFDTWFDPDKRQICHERKLQALYMYNGFPMIKRLVSYVYNLIDSYENLEIRRAFDDHKEMQLERIKYQKYPEGMKAEAPDPYAEGDKEVLERLEELKEEKEKVLENGSYEEHKTREAED